MRKKEAGDGSQGDRGGGGGGHNPPERVQSRGERDGGGRWSARWPERDGGAGVSNGPRGGGAGGWNHRSSQAETVPASLPTQMTEFWGSKELRMWLREFSPLCCLGIPIQTGTQAWRCHGVGVAHGWTESEVRLTVRLACWEAGAWYPPASVSCPSRLSCLLEASWTPRGHLAHFQQTTTPPGQQGALR